MVIVSSAVLVAVAAELAGRMNVPPSIIAATLVAFGTSLPEMTVVVTATLKGHGELAVGNVIGADVLNVLFVAGGAAAVTPGGLAADPIFFLTHFPAMLFLILVFRVGIRTARHGVLPRAAGVVLLGTYVAVTGLSYLGVVPGACGIASPRSGAPGRRQPQFGSGALRKVRESVVRGIRTGPQPRATLASTTWTPASMT